MNQNDVDLGTTAPLMLDVKQVAELLQLGTNHVYALAKSGQWG